MEVVKINCYWGTRMVDNGEVISQGQHQIAQITGSGKWSEFKKKSGS